MATKINCISTVERVAPHGWTLEQIAKEAGVTRQRVQQVLKKFPEIERARRAAMADMVAQKDAQRREAMKKRYGGMLPHEFTDSDVRRQQAFKLSRKKGQAYARGVEFDIGWGDLEWPTHCPVLGIELDYYGLDGIQPGSASFDRVDPDKGYVVGNVKVISYRANHIKNNGTAEEHLAIYEYIDKHRKTSTPQA